MELSLIEIFSIIIIHWFSDFVLQTHWQATNKSKDNKALTMHVLTYTVAWYGFLVLFSITNNHILHHPPSYFGWSSKMLLFLPITFVCHWITDYFTSRLNSKLWAKGDVHNFFVSVGFDQVLHYVQLFLTYYLLKTL